MKNLLVLVSTVLNSGINFGIKLKRQLAGLMLSFLFLPCALAATYYVAPGGNDASSGTTLTLPFKTIQKAMDRAVAGDTVFVRGGVYREDVEVFHGGGSAGKMLEVLAYNGELPIIRGSDQVTGWVLHSGNIWKKTGWTYNSQQVFVGGDDSPSLQQIGMPGTLYSTYQYPKAIGTGVSSMIAGSFYYDAAATTLYVWLPDGSDPNASMVEATTKRRLFYMGLPYIHLKGFAFRHSNTSAYIQMGAAVELSSNSIIEQSDIQRTDFAGLSMGYLQTGAQAINCNVSNNGDSGVNAPGSYGFRVFNVKMNNNNTRNFNPLWHAGGFKAVSKAYGTVEFSEVSHNNGSGIWFDYANSGNPIIIRNNFVHDNGPVEAAIFFEVSKNGLIYNNVIANNKRRGIYLSASDNTKVYNNTLVGSGDYSGIELGGMPRTGATLTGNSVNNNIISYGTSKYDLAIAAANGSTIVSNSSDYNDFFRPAGAIQLFMGSVYYTLANFITASNQDLHSLNVNPGFVSLTNPASALSYAVTSSSGIIDKGMSASGVTQDYLQVARPAAAAFDMGAFEYVATSSGTTDSIPPVVSVTSPSSNTIISAGTSLTISATAADNVGVTGMSLYVDGGSNVRSTTGRISYTWNSTGAKLGTHTIAISASDAKNNLGKQYITFKVQ